MSGVWRDVRFGLRVLLRKPAFTLPALLSLVLGIGLNTAIFTLLDRVFWNPLPVADPGTLVSVFLQLRNPESGAYEGVRGFSHPNFLDFRERNHALSAFAIYQWWPMNLTGGSEPQRVTGMFVSADYFRTLGVEPARGRFFLPEEDATAGTPAVAVLSHGAWGRLFGGEAGVVGRTVQVNGRDFQVVGVAPSGFKGTELAATVDVWVPVTMFPVLSPYAAYFDVRDVSLFRGIGRLRPGVSLEQAGDDLLAVARGLEEEYPKLHEGVGAAVMPLVEAAVDPRQQDQRERYWSYGRSLAWAVGAILLIACLNVASLLLARGVERGREVAVRRAVGAGRRRVVRQLVTESLCLFLLGGLLSLPVARLALDLLWRFRPTQFAADALRLDLDLSVLGFAFAAALLTGLLFGLVPALRASNPDLVHHLKETPAGTPTGRLPRWLRLRNLLVIAQVALTLAALIGAGLFLQSLANARRIALGFEPERLAVVTVTPGDQGYEAPRTEAYYRQVLETVAALPGVEAAALSENRLLRGGVLQRQVYLPGVEEATTIHGRSSHRTNTVTPGFFSTVGIPLLHGSDFADHYPDDAPPVAIINRTMAETLWPGEDAVGRTFHFDELTTPPVEVVGVVADSKVREIAENPQFFIYRPLAQQLAAAMTLHVRTAGDPTKMLPTLTHALRQLDPAVPLADVGTMSHFVDEALWLERTEATLLSVFAGLGLVLALVGIFGVSSYSVRQRRPEIGIRISLGARRADVLREIVGEAAVLAGIGVALGVLLAYLGLRWLQVADQLHGVAPDDPVTYGGFALALLAVALLGSLLPARRATRTDPVTVLRSE